jgi:hypothetical protein
MKTIISKPTQSFSVKNTGIKTTPLIPAFIFLLLSFVFSGSTLFPQVKNVNINNPNKKKLDILEKLESGKKISSDEIRASYCQLLSDDPEPWEFYTHGMPHISDTSSFSKPDLWPGPSYYIYHDKRNHIIISDQDLKEMHRRLKESMDELRENIESFRNSDDFKMMHDELQKWSENFRKELEKMSEGMMRSEYES